MSAGLSIAAERTIPTPVPGGYVDTESSVNVPLPDWPDLGRRVKIDLSAYVTPSNAVQIAFGQDTSGNEDLEPEETALVIGVDCGESFVRDETGGEMKWRWRVDSQSCSADQQGGEATSSSLQQEEGDHHSSTSTFNFNFRQPPTVSDRFTHAKVTICGKDAPQPTITADVRKPGVVLFVR